MLWCLQVRSTTWSPVPNLRSDVFSTPKLLLLSGIGPADELSRHGIPQVVNSPSVGRNLHDHVANILFFRLRDPKLGLAAGSPGFNKPAFLEGAPMDYILTESVPDGLIQKALVADGEDVTDSHPHLRQRGHYESIILYGPAVSFLLLLVLLSYVISGSG